MERRYTLERVAKELDVSRETIRLIECPKERKRMKRLDLAYLEMFALLYNIDPVELVPTKMISPFVGCRNEIGVCVKFVRTQLEINMGAHGDNTRIMELFCKIAMLRFQKPWIYKRLVDLLQKTTLYMEIVDIRADAVTNGFLKRYRKDKKQALQEIINLELKKHRERVENADMQGLTRDRNTQVYALECKLRDELYKDGLMDEITKNNYNLLERFGEMEKEFLEFLMCVLISSEDKRVDFCSFVESSRILSN